MAIPILNITQTKDHLHYLYCLGKSIDEKQKQSNQITGFLQASTMLNFAFLETRVFNYFVLQNEAKIL